MCRTSRADSASTCSASRVPTVACAGAAALSARRHSAEAASPDVGGERRIDLDYHVRRARVAAPGGRRELDQLIGEIASTPLDRSRPLWEMYIAEAWPTTASRSSTRSITCWPTVSRRPTRWRRRCSRTIRPKCWGCSRTRSARTGNLLKAAGRDHVRLIRKLPRLMNETATGCRGSGGGPRSAASIPTWPATSPRRTASSTMSSHRGAGSRRRRWRWRMSRRPASTSASRSTTWCSRCRRARCAGCCCDTTDEPDAPLIAGVPVSYQPVTGSVGGQRVHLHHPVVAGAYRRSAGAGAG